METEFHADLEFQNQPWDAKTGIAEDIQHWLATEYELVELSQWVDFMTDFLWSEPYWKSARKEISDWTLILRKAL